MSIALYSYKVCHASRRLTQSNNDCKAVVQHLGMDQGVQQAASISCVQGFPTWQVVVCDLRCHGESAMIGSLPGEPHNVQTSAGDVLALLRQLKLFPEVLVGHSFGGKVVMSMAQQFSRVGSRMPCPVQVPSCHTSLMHQPNKRKIQLLSGSFTWADSRKAGHVRKWKHCNGGVLRRSALGGS